MLVIALAQPMVRVGEGKTSALARVQALEGGTG
jgi:hypothetical protein